MSAPLKYDRQAAANRVAEHPEPTLTVAEICAVSGMSRGAIIPKLVGVEIAGFAVGLVTGKPSAYYDRDLVVKAILGQP